MKEGIRIVGGFEKGEEVVRVDWLVVVENDIKKEVEGIGEGKV